MVVYLVSSGAYSDYSVHSIFSTKERAEQYVALVPEHYDARIEEFELDNDTACELFLKVAHATIVVSTGEIAVRPTELELRPVRYSHVDDLGATIHAYSVRGEEHAKKLAIEARQKKLREVVDRPA